MDNIMSTKTEMSSEECLTYGQNVWSRLQELDENNVCLIEAQTDERLTVSELKTRINSIAVALIERGINKTDKIAFCGQNSIQHLVMRFATTLLGNTFTPIHHRNSSYETTKHIRDVGANIIMCSAKHLNKFNDVFNSNDMSVKLVVVFNGVDDKYVTYEQLLEEGRDQTLERIPYFDVKVDDIFIIVQTSGTTGAPKYVMLSHKIYTTLKQPSKSPAVLAVLRPLGFLSGTNSIPTQMLTGSTVVLFDEMDERFILASVEKYRICHLQTQPNISLLEEMDANNYDISCLKSVSSDGTPVPVHIANGLIKRAILFVFTYGMTECGLIARGFFCESNVYTQGCVGHMFPEREIKIVDLKTGESLGSGIDGEIYVRIDNAFLGYYNNDGAKNDAIAEEGWFRTGDIGHCDDRGQLFITDRLKEMFIVSIGSEPKHLSPVEIEQYLLTHTSIADVVVVGINNSVGTQWPRAYVVVKPGQTVTEEEVKRYVFENLSPFKQLKGGVVFVERIHRTGSEKIDRKFYRNLIKDEMIE